MKFRDIAWIGILTSVWFQLAFYYPKLPESMAFHFDFFGSADGWMAKSNFLIIHIVATGLLILIGWVLPLFLHHLPSAMILVPNKGYWLSSERKNETFVWLADWGTTFGTATLFFATFVFQMVIETNLSSQKTLSGLVPWACGLYLLFSAVWVVIHGSKFKKDRRRL